MEEIEENGSFPYEHDGFPALCIECQKENLFDKNYRLDSKKQGRFATFSNGVDVKCF